MHLLLNRQRNTTNSTGGTLSVDGEISYFTCEDEYREVKVPGKTRIPEGTYKVLLRDEGGMTKRYAEKLAWHKGMLHLQDVEGFEWVYIHIGNTDDHTSGCILVGLGALWRDDCTVTHSEEAYKDFCNE